MLARLRKAKENGEGGFTLIELLVVMIIIGILAAVAIPVFLSQREKARDTSTKADVSTVGKELATYYVDGADGGPSLTQAAGPGTPVTLVVKPPAKPPVTVTTVEVSDGTALVSAAADAADGTNSTDWCVSLTNDDGATGAFNYSAATGLGEGDCTP